MRNSIIAILLLALVGVSSFFAGRYTAPQPAVETVTVRDTIPGDSVPYKVEVRVPIPYLVLRSDTVLIDVDTAAILAAYFAHYFYADTLMNDTSAFIALAEIVTENRIVERSLMFQNRRPTAIITNTTTVTLPSSARSWQLYGGAVIGRDVAAPLVQLGYNKWQLGAGYNLQQGGVVVGVGYRIR